MSDKSLFTSPEILDHSDLEPAENPFDFYKPEKKDTKIQYLEMDDLPYKREFDIKIKKS